MRRVTAALLIWLSATSAAAQPADYRVEIQAGVLPRMSPSSVAAYVLAAVRRGQAAGDREPRVVSVECDGGVKFRSHFSHPERRNGGPIWMVRLKGRFVNHHTGPGARSATMASASYLVDDETGEFLGWGMSDRISGGSGGVDRLTKGR
jgi:hypothetical protein